jgi:RND family efflux transporter MFP subunit
MAFQLAAVSLTFLSVSGCGPSTTSPTGGSHPVVSVSPPILQQVTDYKEYTGRTAATDSVQIRARVTGYLVQINFKEGTEVKEGAVLYEIDPRPYQAIVDQAKAQVQLQEANLKFQESEYIRTEKLFKSGTAVSKEEFERIRSARDTAIASLQAAKASREQADLNLGFTKVTAPITGLLGRTLITRGNLVVADQTVLTTVVSQDPMYAYFDVEEQTVMHVRRLIYEGKIKSRLEGTVVPVSLALADEKDFPHQGTVDFVNNQVDPSTGTLQVRGVFRNPKPPAGPRLLTSGLFVRIRVATGPPYQALLVNQRAVGADQNFKYLYVLNDKNEVVRRDVKLGWVAAEADEPFRTSAEKVKQMKVRNSLGQMVPLGTVAKIEDIVGPTLVMRYNMYTSASVNGNAAPGVSSGDVIKVVTQWAEELGITFEWTEIAYLQIQAGNVGLWVFALGTVMVYLVLAAKYESSRLPLSVILVVPLCVLAAVTGMTIARQPVDIFVQIGLLVLIGLATKNAILIVEFANQLRQEGRDLRQAALEASQIRFRPIIMTSFAFILGVVPLVIASRAGAEMRQSLGMAVFSGMIGVTFFGVFLTPVFFFVVMWFRERRLPRTTPAAPPRIEEQVRARR